MAWSRGWPRALAPCSGRLATVARPGWLAVSSTADQGRPTYEISVVCLPADWTARFCREIPSDEVDRVAAATAALSQHQTELREAVRIHQRMEWQGLARTLAPAIALRLGVDAVTTSTALVDAVTEHLGP